MAISRRNQSWIHVLVDGRAISFVQRDNHESCRCMHDVEGADMPLAGKCQTALVQKLGGKGKSKYTRHSLCRLPYHASLLLLLRERIASCAVVSLYHLADLANNASSITPSTL
jgi:uncharacterized protein YjhX (UPF0386 family)